MPTRPLSHEQRQHRAHRSHDRQQHDRQYAAHRRAVHGPDPRSTVRWRRLRALLLNGQPFCADPYTVHGAYPPLAVEVDHIQGVWVRPDLVFDQRNLQPLCTACHSRKSHEERHADRHG